MVSRFVAGLAVALACVFTLPAAAQEAAPRQEMRISAGAHELYAHLHAPAGRARYPVVVLVSGSGNQSELDGVYTQILARTFTQRGLGVLAYDKRGVGRSGGVYTGSDFEALGADAASVVRHAAALPQVSGVGLWGISQAGWIIPYAVRRAPARFAIIVSPAGVNPYEQVTYFLRRQTLAWGLSADEVNAAEAMHRAVALYYSGRESYAAAQAEVDRHVGARWFNGVVTHPYWDEMTPEGRILTPEELRQAQAERPGAFEIYMSASSFRDYTRTYRALRRLPTLIVYGANDELVPPAQSRAVFERALRNERRHEREFRVFENAGHDITGADGRVAPGYLELIGDWAAARFAAR